MSLHRVRTTVMFLLAFLFILAAIGSPEANAQTKLLRFPDIYKDTIVFCYGGDLWTASAAGGDAVRLTAHPGLELFPKYSPDGQWIAFTGQYDGDEQVYVIPSRGGVPQKLTYYPANGPLPPRWGYDNQVYGWTRDGKSVLFRSMRDGWDLTDTRLYTVAVDGGMPAALAMPVSGAGDFSPDGTQVVYSPLVRDFRTWKRYQGGWAQDLYIFDLNTRTAKQITDDPRSDRDPMWIGDTVYFASDRDGTLNLYAYTLLNGETRQLTRSTTWDVRWPSADDEGTIIFELDGELTIFDVASGSQTKLSIYVPDDGLATRPATIPVGNLIENWELSPKGERALFSARGDIFTAPIEKGPSRNLTNSSGAHDKWPSWSPDGSQIAFISDLDGEEEIYIVKQDGSETPVQLTDGGSAMRYQPIWSSDGKHIAFSDKNGRLFVVNVGDKSIMEIAHDKSGNLRDYAWSPNGGYIAFSLTDPNSFRSIYIWSAASGNTHRVTGEQFNEYDPVWDPQGNYLYYMSDREYAPQIGSIEWNYVVDRETGIFALALRADVKHPFPPESDEVTVGDAGTDEKKEEGADAEKDKKDKEGKKDKVEKKEYIKIDFDGLSGRITRVPVSAENYFGLAATKEYLLYVRGNAFYYGRQPDQKSSLRIFSFKDRKENELAEDVSGYALSYDGSKVLVRQSDSYNLYEVKPKAADSKKTVSTKGLRSDRIPHEEWEQIFNEVWRRFRDFFYAKNMHGNDWNALRDQYSTLLPYIAHRSDLNYVLGEMVAELSTSHSYISGGDYAVPVRPQAGLPGARFELDEKSGRYRISSIMLGQNQEDLYRAPLTEIGVSAHVGDYVLAIDGEELTAAINPYRLLLNKSDRPVELTLNDKPVFKGSNKVTYNPVSNESSLLYLNWVTKNLEYVTKKTGGRVGYLHVPDMGSDGIREFIKWYYGQIDKEGLIIDVRGNGGGNVSQMLIERLKRVLLSVDYSRNDEYPQSYPQKVFNGHLVCLLSETSASDGDIFPAMFRKAGLGKLIGKRSWGGVIGISGHGQLIDGGSVYVPEYGFINTDGKWDIENYGVEPDIVVENDPASVLAGRDNQLDRGIEEVMQLIEKHPMHYPPRPADPVKTK